MVIIDEKLLKEFRIPGECEWCGVWSDPREGHHILLRKMGGSSRMDLRINLISLGNSFSCECHALVHQGELMADDLFAKVAAREGLMQDPIREALEFIRRYDKKSLPSQREHQLMGLTGWAREIVQPILERWCD